MSNVASDDALMTIKELADYLKVGVGAIYDWRYKKIGPPSVKAGGKPRYRRSAVDAWLEREQEQAG
jgi:excisionase family DNA binding protein